MGRDTVHTLNGSVILALSLNFLFTNNSVYTVPSGGYTFRFRCLGGFAFSVLLVKLVVFMIYQTGLGLICSHNLLQ